MSRHVPTRAVPQLLVVSAAVLALGGCGSDRPSQTTAAAPAATRPSTTEPPSY